MKRCSWWVNSDLAVGTPCLLKGTGMPESVRWSFGDPHVFERCGGQGFFFGGDSWEGGVSARQSLSVWAGEGRRGLAGVCAAKIAIENSRFDRR